MPKNRKRVIQPGAKSEAIRTKHKIGGRKSSKGLKQTSTKELLGLLPRARRRDYAAIEKELDNRDNTLAVIIG